MENLKLRNLEGQKDGWDMGVPGSVENEKGETANGLAFEMFRQC